MDRSRVRARHRSASCCCSCAGIRGTHTSADHAASGTCIRTLIHDQRDSTRKLRFGRQASREKSSRVDGTGSATARIRSWRGRSNHFHNPLTAWTVAGLGWGPVVRAVAAESRPGVVVVARPAASMYEAMTKRTRAEREEALARTAARPRPPGPPRPGRRVARPHPQRSRIVFGYQYEKFVLRILSALEAGLHRFGHLSRSRSVPIPPGAPYRPTRSDRSPAALLLDAEQYRRHGRAHGRQPGRHRELYCVGLAEYTNANFLSEDTLWNNLVRALQVPGTDQCRGGGPRGSASIRRGCAATLLPEGRGR